MARNRRKFSPEFKEEAAKMVVETSQPIAHVARKSMSPPGHLTAAQSGSAVVMVPPVISA